MSGQAARLGFTLAEMMVVMLIMSIILAAMAPVMTTRSYGDGSGNSSPWRYSPENLSDAYFGAGESQIAMIGQPNKLETDDAARLILTTSSSLPVHLSFKRDNTTLGRLQFVDTNLVLGNGSLDHLNGGSNNISIGPNNLTQITSGGSNIGIGDSALSSTTIGTSNIGIGTTLSSNVDGNNNVAVGDDALTKANSTWNVAIGKNAYQLGTGGSNTIIGGDAMSEGSGQNNVTVGTNALWYGNGDGNVAIGANSNYKNKTLTTFSNTTAVGFSSYAGGEKSVALGFNSEAGNGDAIAIGSSVKASDTSTIAIGSCGYYNGSSVCTTALGNRSISIGDGSLSTQVDSIAIGTNVKSENNKTISIGANSKSSGGSSIAIGDGSLAVLPYGIAIGSSSEANAMSSTALGQEAVADLVSSTAIGAESEAYGKYSLAVGANSKAKKENTIAIGYNACSGVTGSNKICIGANSGKTGFPTGWASDSQERIYIGSQSKFNDGTAVLEVHNTSERFTYPGNSDIGGYDVNGSGVVINGSLIVKGPIIARVNTTANYSTWTTGNQDLPVGVINTNMAGGPTLRDLFFNEAHRSGANPIELAHPLWSDLRLKYVGKESQSGLDKIKQLKVFNYTFKKDETKTPHVGVIAQDLQKVFPDAVKKGTDGFLSIRMEDMFFAMINAIKELDLKYQAQEKRINELEARIERLEDKILY